MKIKEKLIPKFLYKYVIYYQNHGFKKTIKKYGWKAAVGIFFYYLIRDVSLYIILPWYIAKNLIK